MPLYKQPVFHHAENKLKFKIVHTLSVIHWRVKSNNVSLPKHRKSNITLAIHSSKTICPRDKTISQIF